MSMSGIGLDSSALEEYNAFKGNKSNIAFLIFKIQDEKVIVVEKKVMKDEVADLLAEAESNGFRKQPDESDRFALLRSILLKSPPRYAVVVVNYKIDTPQDKIGFIAWCHDNAPVKQRMLTSSSKDNIAKKLEGAVCYQATDESELEFRAVCDGISKGKAKWN